jgi:hypothetical protein
VAQKRPERGHAAQVVRRHQREQLGRHALHLVGVVGCSEQSETERAGAQQRS